MRPPRPSRAAGGLMIRNALYVVSGPASEWLQCRIWRLSRETDMESVADRLLTTSMIAGPCVLIGAVFLWIGACWAKGFKVTYWQSLGVFFASNLAGAAVFWLVYEAGGRSGNPDIRSGVTVPAVAAGLGVSWVVIAAMLKIGLGRAIKAWLPVLAPLLFVLAMGPFPGDGHHQLSLRSRCATNVSNIGKAIAMYQGSYSDQFPASLEDLIKDGQSPNIMVCPADAKKRRFSYFYLRPVGDSNADADTIVACDFKDNHPGQYRNILYADTHVGNASEEVFQKLLAKPVNADFAKALKTAEGERFGPPNAGEGH